MPFVENQIIFKDFIYQVGTNQIIDNYFSVYIMLKLIILQHYRGHSMSVKIGVNDNLNLAMSEVKVV